MVCKHCHINKTPDEFYKGQGYQCKECAKKRQACYRKRYMENKEWVEAERARGREKAKRFGYKSKPHTVEQHKAWRAKYPEKYAVKQKCANIKGIPGFENHHWSYNLEHYKDTITLSIELHSKLHRYIEYDQAYKMYRTLNGVLLDTKEKHIEYFNSIKDKP